MMLELAIGDAYGAGFEYASTNMAHNDLSRYVRHPRHAIPLGAYTDDTQMSIALAEVITTQQPWTPEVLASAFVTVFKRDPREGYAGSFYAFLQHVQDGSQFLREIRPTSDKSGAAMRSGPVGVFASIAEVMQKSTLQAKVTHNTPAGIAASNAAALMTHYFLYRLGTKAELGQFVDRHVPGYSWAVPWRRPVKSKGWMSVRAAITALARNDTLSSLLKDCVSFTGDVDTVATIALAAAACSMEYVKDLPTHLVATLENGSYGRDYLIALDQRLLARTRT